MKPIIKLSNVTFTYEDEVKPVLNNLSLEVFEGEFILIVGPSGSGKSTVCQLFNGTIPNLIEGEISGDIHVDSKNVLKLESSDLAESVGMVYQDPDAQLCNIYVEDEVAFAPENLKVEPREIEKRIKESLQKVGIMNLKHRKVHELSGGQKQKVGIASVLSMEPKILVLDNATANLDPQATKDIFDLLKILQRDFGNTVIVVDSKVDDVMPMADRVITIEEGRVTSSTTPREILEGSIDQLIDMGVWVPEISELAIQLEKKGFQFNQFPITVNEAVSEFKNKTWDTFHHAPELDSTNNGKLDAIAVKNLNYKYPNGTHALKGLNFSIKQGDFVAILGTNGSGKTTLVKHLMGIINPPKNTVFLKGNDTFGKSVFELNEDIGYVFQNPEHQFVAESVLEEAIYSLLIKHDIKKDEGIPSNIIESGIQALENIDLAHLKDKNPFTLSGGEKRRLSVVASLMLGQDIVILDEPTTGQDYANSTKLLELCNDLNKQGKTVIMITHDIRLVCKWAKKALVMSNGNLIYDGEINQLFLRDDVLHSASLIEPPISILSKQLSNKNLKQGVITVDQFLQTAEGVNRLNDDVSIS